MKFLYSQLLPRYNLEFHEVLWYKLKVYNIVVMQFTSNKIMCKCYRWKVDLNFREAFVVE